MGPKTFALVLSLAAALLVESFVESFLPVPARAALGLIVAAITYYFAYPFLKRLKEGDF
jgi:membrane protein implicated in regulation of membrane protease activity